MGLGPLTGPHDSTVFQTAQTGKLSLKKIISSLLGKLKVLLNRWHYFAFSLKACLKGDGWQAHIATSMRYGSER